MKLALHIGTARTGTTTLQVWASGNRGGLEQQGICYSTLMGERHHRRLMVYALETDASDPVLTGVNIRSDADHEAFRAQTRDDLAREVAESQAKGHHTWLMSSELLHSRITSRPTINRLHALLAPHFTQITVYLHLRPQVDMLVSNASQTAYLGRPVNRANLTRPGFSANSNVYNYDNFLRNWEAVFGVQNMRLVPYRRIPDITQHMIRTLGIDPAPLLPVVSVNPGLDWQGIALANLMQAGFSALGISKPPGFYLREMHGGTRLQLGLALAKELQARFDDFNARLAQRRSDITLDDLTPDWSQYDEVGNLDIVEAPCLFAPQVAQMARRFAQDRALERWRRHLAEGRVAALTGDMAGLEAAKLATAEAAAELDSLGLTNIGGWDEAVSSPDAGSNG